jgi:hypothetical protein
VDVQVRVGKLGQLVEVRGQAPVAGIGVDPPRHLDEDAAVGLLGDEVDGDQRAERVVEGGGEEDPAVERVFEQRALDREVADLRGVGAARAGR